MRFVYGEDQLLYISNGGHVHPVSIGYYFSIQSCLQVSPSEQSPGHFLARSLHQMWSYPHRSASSFIVFSSTVLTDWSPFR